MQAAQWQKLSRIDGRRRALLIEAALWLALARAMLLMMPFRRIAAQLGNCIAPADASASARLVFMSFEQAQLATQIGWAVACATRHLPFKAVCLPQAIAAKAMLKRRGIESVLHLGAAKTGEPNRPLQAHAWLDTAGVKITGYPIAADFTEIARFV